MTEIIIMMLCIQLAIILAGYRVSNSLNDIAEKLKELNNKKIIEKAREEE